MAILGVLNKVDNIHNFDPDKHIPNLENKVILVTGGNSGVGKETVLQLAKHRPKRLYLAARSKAKYEEALADIKVAVPDATVDFLELDLASLSSVKQAADKVLSENDRLDILINNAGIAGQPHGLTRDGYELVFGTNHMGHALLTKLLLPLLQKTARSARDADVRIVILSSSGELMASGIKFDKLKTDMKSFHPLSVYAQSKLANVLHGRELARRHPELLSVSVHPGRVQTNISNVVLSTWSLTSCIQTVLDTLAGTLTVEQGALCQIWAATWKREDVENGEIYWPVGKGNQGSKLSKDQNLAKKLWEWQEDEFKKLGYV